MSLHKILLLSDFRDDSEHRLRDRWTFDRLSDGHSQRFHLVETSWQVPFLLYLPTCNVPCILYPTNLFLLHCLCVNHCISYIKKSIHVHVCRRLINADINVIQAFAGQVISVGTILMVFLEVVMLSKSCEMRVLQSLMETQNNIMSTMFTSILMAFSVADRQLYRLRGVPPSPG